MAYAKSFSITLESKGKTGEFYASLNTPLEFPNENFEAALTDITYPSIDTRQYQLRALLKYFTADQISKHLILKPQKPVRAIVYSILYDTRKPFIGNTGEQIYVDAREAI